MAGSSKKAMSTSTNGSSPKSALKSCLSLAMTGAACVRGSSVPAL
jgi:hypothetical protein